MLRLLTAGESLRAFGGDPVDEAVRNRDSDLSSLR